MIKKLYSKIKKKYKYLLFREKNKNNQIKLVDFNDCTNVYAGNFSYGDISLFDFHNGSKLIIGNFVSIAKGVFFCIGGEHVTNNLSTYPFESKITNNIICSQTKGDIVIKDDVWIGVNCTVLSGVTINQGAVVAAGSVVTKDVPPYSIVGGVPAKVIRYRFDENIINKLLKIDYSKMTKNIIIKNRELFNIKIDSNNIDDILRKLEEE